MIKIGQKMARNEKINILIFWPVQNNLLAILIFCFSNDFFIFQKSSKIYQKLCFFTNGPRECDFHEETIAIDTGETDFRSTATHFMHFSTFLYFSNFLTFSPNSWNSYRVLMVFQRRRGQEIHSSWFPVIFIKAYAQKVQRVAKSR